MNQRIDELMIEAGARFEFLHGVHYDDFQYEKFAELIVRECLAQADNIREGCEVDGKAEQALGADWVGLAIARHFGVEE